MKYEAEVDEDNRNTSHGLMLDLVGSDQRVLDVGCATGYLARALAGRGCTVSGVEVDPEAAEQARPVLKDLVVGDLESLDLGAQFGQGGFDAIVFGDVLEHLRDPLRVLRSSLPLLDDGGFVVMSIPNIAHASVRLALLKGRFEYNDLGLLDQTHLRFFTRESLEELLRDAGLIAVDWRRTTAGAFETEISIDPGEFDPSVVAALGNDLDGRTYQFVVKAIPTDSSPGLRRLHELTTEQGAEITRLRRTLAAVLASDDQPVVPVQVGLWGHFGLDDLATQLHWRVVRDELARRIPGGTMRCFAPVVSANRSDPVAPLESLGPWSSDRADALRDQLDAVVVTGPLGVPPSVYGAEGPVDQVVELDAVLSQGLGTENEDTCPLLFLAVERSPQSPVPAETLAAALLKHRLVASIDPSVGSPVMPDPLLLIDRVYTADQLAHRGAYLRLMGWFPASGPAVVVHGERSLDQHAPALAAVVDELAAARGAGCVLLETNLLADDAAFIQAIGAHLGRPAGIVPIDAGALDVVAALANADVVVTSSPSLLAVALALGRPCVGMDFLGSGRFDRLAAQAGISDLILTRPRDLPGALDLLPSSDAREAVLKRLRRLIDSHFDAVAAVISDSAKRRRASDIPPAEVLSATARLRALETAHEALQRRMAAERLAFADQAIVLKDRCRAELDRAEAALADARLRIDAIYATRTMRALNPARQVYARLRARAK